MIYLVLAILMEAAATILLKSLGRVYGIFASSIMCFGIYFSILVDSKSVTYIKNWANLCVLERCGCGYGSNFIRIFVS